MPVEDADVRYEHFLIPHSWIIILGCLLFLAIVGPSICTGKRFEKEKDV